MIAVKLESYEMNVAVAVGSARNASAILKGSKNVYDGDPVRYWGQHIDGAGAEMAFAKFIGLYWDGSVDTYRKSCGDLPHTGIDVKHSKDGFWKVKDRDKGELVLVSGTMPDFVIDSYCNSDEVKSASPQISVGLWNVAESVKRRNFDFLMKKIWRKSFDVRTAIMNMGGSL